MMSPPFDPGTPQRYKDFCTAWRDRGCVVPWLDGVDEADSAAPHVLVDAKSRWAIFPINSSNWCHAAAILPEPLATVWSTLPQLAAGSDKEMEADLRKQLDALARYDMARVSEQQLEQVRRLVEATRPPDHEHQLRIAVLHHHLRAPSLPGRRPGVRRPLQLRASAGLPSGPRVRRRRSRPQA